MMMAEMRDLKADLDWMMKSPSDHAKELEIAVHALERAIEAESLARELVEALEEAIWLLESYTGRYEDIERLAKELVKAKEVLGDGN